MTTYLNDPLTWAVSIIAVAVLGMGKGGLAGLGMLATPIIATVLPAKAAIGIILPILIAQDVVSVWAFRKEWDKWIVAWMLPGAVIGIGLGWLLSTNVQSIVLTATIGVLTAIFAAHRLWMERGNEIVEPSKSKGWVGSVFGVAMGFTSQVTHSGAPPFQMWVTPRKLTHTIYVGTSAVLFAAVNWLKVPAYISFGALTRDVLITAAILLPISTLFTLASLKFIRRMPPQNFYRLVYWLMLALGLYLIFRTLI